MGLEARCSARAGRRRSEGRALLESSELIFRGEFRLVITFAEMQSVVAKDGRLEITHAQGKLVLELGAAAEKWAERIRNPKSRLDKLGVKPGMRVGLVAIDDDGFERELRERGAELAIGKPGAESDLVFFGATRKAELSKLGAIRKRIRSTGAIWVIWPKGRPELREDDVRTTARAVELVDVKVVAFSATASGLKLVIPVAKR